MSQEALGDPIVSVQHLTRRFGEFLAVDDVSFDVARSEVFGFLGPNGAGKTTTIKMLTGLLLPSSGSGQVAGFDLMTSSESIKASIGYMSQAFSLYGDLTVIENIEFFAGLYGVARERRRERQEWVLETSRLTDERNRMVRELSLGYKQRLALGCAVLHEPSVVFLDEPTSGVDPISRRRFWELIDQLARAGTTVFVTTHYMVEAEYCGRLALMNRGRLVALDTPAGIHNSLDRPLLEIECSDVIRAVRIIEHAGLFGRFVHAFVEDERAAHEEIRSRLERESIRVTRIERIEPSLEDVFVALVEGSGGAVE